MSNQLFTPGQVGATATLIAELESEGRIVNSEFGALLDRHLSGDWGNVDPHDARVNRDALAHGDRILSSYSIGEIRVYIITEADRSSTTIMRPEDY